MNFNLTKLDECTLNYVKNCLGDRVAELDMFLKTLTIRSDKHALEAMTEIRDNIKRNFNRLCDYEREVAERNQY